MKQEALYPRCAMCGVLICENKGAKADGPPPDVTKAPPFCPMRLLPEIYDEAQAEYDDPVTGGFARLGSIQESEGYEKTPHGRKPVNSRLEELIQFARKCSYKRLGIAHCGGLLAEARTLSQILEKNGFEVVTVMCKTGGVPKERLGLLPEQKLGEAEDWESMCNPIAQAKLINASRVDFAVMLGLCIGHDTLFLKYCEVPVTVFAVKDRLMGHNPLAALYTSGSYYKRLADGI